MIAMTGLIGVLQTGLIVASLHVMLSLNREEAKILRFVDLHSKSQFCFQFSNFSRCESKLHKCCCANHSDTLANVQLSKATLDVLLAQHHQTV